MASRFYFPAEGSGVPNISPAYDGSWEQTGQATRLKLLYKPSLSVLSTIAATTTRTVPITTTQDILCNQFVSDVIPPQLIDTSCLFSLVISCLESSSVANASLDIVGKICSNDGGTFRGILFGLNTGASFGITTSTRIQTKTAVTAVTTQPGDRLIIEIGAHVTAPTGAANYNLRQGTNNASDFALTTGLTTDLNPWCEFSRDLFSVNNENYKSVKSSSAGIISVGERIR